MGMRLAKIMMVSIMLVVEETVSEVGEVEVEAEVVAVVETVIKFVNADRVRVRTM